MNGSVAALVHSFDLRMLSVLCCRAMIHKRNKIDGPDAAFEYAKHPTSLEEFVLQFSRFF